VGRADRKNNLVYLGVDWMIILQWIFKKWDVKVWTGLFWLRIGTSDGLL
jgi:hypothetical protein